MKTLFKYPALIAFMAVICLFLSVPAMAQRGGGGGGHSGGGGGGGGGHVSGGGGAHFGGGSSGAARVGYSGSRGVYSGSRGAYSGSRGTYAPRTGVAGSRSSVGYRGGSVRAGNSASGVRPYIKGNNGAGMYGHGGAYGHYGWGHHGGWFYNRGFYGGLYYPWLGYGFWDLPYGCYPFYWGDYLYYYGDGFFYQNDGGQYTVVEPPVGAEVTELPSDASSIMIDGEQYYEEKGVYYKPVKKDDGTIVYQVAGKDGELNTGQTGVASVTPRVGELVQQLPADCRKVHLNGNAYYVSEDGIYYQQTVDANGNKAYKIVALDSGDQGNQGNQ